MTSNRSLAEGLSQELAPFLVEAQVVTEWSRAGGGANSHESIESSISFEWSNGTWEIEQTCHSVPEFVKRLRGTNVSAIRIVNCKRIPDGVRFYSLFLNENQERVSKGMPIAKVLPMALPPVDYRELLLSWLALCPNAELPIVSLGQIRRFTSQELLNRPENVGTYDAKYLGSEAVFLSELSISDNGSVILSNGDIVPRKAPLNEGSVEFQFRVLESTNIHGMLFPKRATLKLLSPLLDENGKAGSWPQLVCTLEVGRIQTDVGEPISSDMPLFVIDERIPRVPGKIGLNYVVTNDRFVPKDNSELIRLASISEYDASSRVSGHSKRRVIWLGLVLLAVAPLGSLCWVKLKSHQKESRR